MKNYSHYSYESNRKVTEDVAQKTFSVTTKRDMKSGT